MVRENDLAVLLSLHELELAERISDTVVCVAGDRIDRIGPPEEIFTRAYIAKLYRMEHGKYDPCFDSLEFVPKGVATWKNRVFFTPSAWAPAARSC